MIVDWSGCIFGTNILRESSMKKIASMHAYAY